MNQEDDAQMDLQNFDLEAFADRFLATGSPSPPEATTFSSILEELLLGNDSQVQISQRNLAEAVGLVISKLRGEFLVQVWAPSMRDKKLVLTTQGQPFSVTTREQRNSDLIRYRALSTGYVFPTTSNSINESQGEFFPGLPGRVFTRLTPEWTPNVLFYNCREYLRVGDAASCNIRGSLALPVINPASGTCVAVLELVSNFEKLDYVNEIEIISNALQVVNLSSSRDVGNCLLPPEIPPKKGREAVFAEISHILSTICEAHNLPLAQTWVPFIEVEKQVQQKQVLSTRGAPYYVVASGDLWNFHNACSGQVLEIGQGVAGRAFLINQPSFKENVCNFSREEYPFVHYARYFKLGAAVGIRLRSILTGTEDYVLEFFLPRDCLDRHGQQNILSALSMMLQVVCKSLRTVSSRELRDLDLADESDIKSKQSRSSDEGDSFSTSQGKKPDKKRSSNEKMIPLEILQKHFAGSLKDAAKSIGVCPTTLKRICRQYGISRWPSRKINKVSRSLAKLQGVIDSVEGIDRSVKLDSLNGEMANTILATENLTRKTQGDDTLSCSNEVVDRATKSCGISSIENYPLFVKTEQRVHGSSAALSSLGMTSEDSCFQSRTGSEQDLQMQQMQYIPEYIPGRLVHSSASSMVTIKAKLGSDNARFKLSIGFDFARLRDEVASRFKLDPETSTLKYLDDDAEWVMLNCDEDLQECLDVMKATTLNTIKLVVQEVSTSSSSI